MRQDAVISGLGASSEEPVFVVDPRSKRERRWDELNNIIFERKGLKATYSPLTLDDVKSVLRTTPYNQNWRDIDEERLDRLIRFLSDVTTCFNYASNEAKR